MSEQPKDWTKVVREIFKEEAAAILKALPPLEKSGETAPSAKEHKHFKSGDDICPDCYPAARKAIFDKEFKGADYKCLGCGLPVRGEESGKEEWNCPNCGGNEANER